MRASQAHSRSLSIEDFKLAKILRHTDHQIYDYFAGEQTKGMGSLTTNNWNSRYQYQQQSKAATWEVTRSPRNHYNYDITDTKGKSLGRQKVNIVNNKAPRAPVLEIKPVKMKNAACGQQQVKISK